MFGRKPENNYVHLPDDGQRMLLRLFVRDKQFYRTFFSLLIVIGLQQLATLTVNLVDNLMLGAYSEAALSGATLVNQIQYTLQQLTMGVGMGIVVLGSQYWGKAEITPIKKIISVGMKFNFVAGAIFFAVTYFVPEAVLRIFSDDPVVLNEGLKYLKIMCWTYIIFSLSSGMVYALQCVESATIGTVMSLSTICINACLNYLLIFGNFGFREMGITGAAIATLTSRIVELIIILVYVLFVDKKLRMTLNEIVKWDFSYLSDFVKVATPYIISGMLWGFGQAAHTAIMGHVGSASTAVAANSIAAVYFQVFSVFGTSCSSVASVIIGKTIGENHLNKVKPYSKTLQALFVLLGLATGGVMLLCIEPVISLYSISDEAYQLAIQFMTIVSITTVGTCYEYTVGYGIIGGGGSTKYPVIMDNLFIWFFTIPLAYVSAFVLCFPPYITFVCLKIDQLIKCVPNFITCNRYRWVKTLTR